ncbi:hypothetical protein AB0L25_16075 [Spirillospora sp. NPDC052242]
MDVPREPLPLGEHPASRLTSASSSRVRSSSAISRARSRFCSPSRPTKTAISTPDASAAAITTTPSATSAPDAASSITVGPEHSAAITASPRPARYSM